MFLTKIRWQQWLAILFSVGLITLAWIYRDALADYLSDANKAQAWLRSLGPLGPIMLVVLNAAQIVVAPVPGYFVQAAAGWAFGAWPGAIYGTIGIAVGGALAAYLSRTLGRPFASRMVGEQRLIRWEKMTRADSPWLWAVLLLGPVGDIPYFLAGLSTFPILNLVLIAVVVRFPSVILASAVGAGVLSLNREVLVAVFVVTAFVLIFLYRYSARLQDAAEDRILRRVQSPEAPAPLESHTE